MARVAVVTGGTRGIGEAISVGLKEAGYNVAAVYAGNDEKAREFTDRTGIAAFKWDVSDFEACKAGLAKVEAELGPVEIVVNNASITRDGVLHRMSFEQWNDVVATNLTSCFNMCRNVIDGMRERGLRAVSPLVVQMYMPNGAAAAVGLERKAKAGVSTLISACASGSEAIANAWRQLVLGEADVAITGGVETKIEAVPIAGFAQMRIVLSNTNDNPAGACRPFDRDRNGFVFGEGGAMLVLETEEHAKARGANILARLMGASVTSDGYHIVAPDPNGEQAGYAMTRAIELAGLVPSDIDHVNAHATGTSVGDVAEGVAINNAMKGHRPAVYAPKSALGHSVGAVGAVESILTVLALRDGVIPPTLNLDNLDPEIDLDVVSKAPRQGDYKYAINNSFGFGGHNVALAFGRY